MDMKLTNDKMRTFGGHEKIGVFNAGDKAEHLAYLNGREFTVKNVWFEKDFDRL